MTGWEIILFDYFLFLIIFNIFSSFSECSKVILLVQYTLILCINQCIQILCICLSKMCKCCVQKFEADLLICCLVDLLIYWFVDLLIIVFLICWFVDLFFCWLVDFCLFVHLMTIDLLTCPLLIWLAFTKS